MISYKKDFSIRVLIVYALIIVIMLLDVYINDLRVNFFDYQLYFLSGANFTQKVLIWFLPLFLFPLGTESLMLDINSRVHYLYISKLGKKKFVRKSITKNIVIAEIPFVIGLTINFIATQLMFSSYKPGPNDLDFVTEFAEDKYVSFQHVHPIITICIITMIFLFIIALIVVFSTLLTLLVEDRKISYTMPFISYYFFIMSKFEITGIIQPFDEYGFARDFIPFVLFTSYFVISSLILNFLVRKKYEKIV